MMRFDNDMKIISGDVGNSKHEFNKDNGYEIQTNFTRSFQDCYVALSVGSNLKKFNNQGN